MTQERPPDRDVPETGPDAATAPRAAPGGATHPPAALQSLRQAMRRARADDAERTAAIADHRAARIARLELLEEALEPLVAQIPDDVEMFDVGLMPGSTPRLFLDMIGFVEMGRDARTYRLVQDTRHGRRVVAESDSIPAMVEVATDYVARRLLERDKALAADALPSDRRPAAAAHARAGPDGALSPARRRRSPSVLGAAFAMLIDLLGAIAFFAILFSVAWFVWQRVHGQV